MYSHEIETYLRVRNYLLKTPEEIFEVTDLRKNPQINWISFHNGPNDYEVKTSDDYYFKFHILTIAEYAKECEEIRLAEEAANNPKVIVMKKCG
jgi:hypothetical protein